MMMGPSLRARRQQGSSGRAAHQPRCARMNAPQMGRLDVFHRLPCDGGCMTHFVSYRGRTCVSAAGWPLGTWHSPAAIALSCLDCIRAGLSRLPPSSHAMHIDACY